MLETAAHEAATSPHSPLRHPTHPQIKAGNYKKGHLRLHGLRISIENPRGSVRAGVDANGTPWLSKLFHHYGYIKGTQGKDKDHLDVFIGPNPDSARAFIVDQVKADHTTFDEHKILLGFDSLEEAKAGYLANYHTGWTCGPIVEKSIPELHEWIGDGPVVTSASGLVKAAVRTWARLLFAGVGLSKAHVGSYTKRTGQFIRAHEDSRNAKVQKYGVALRVFPSESGRRDARGTLIRYTVRAGKHGLTCNCPPWRFSRRCKHCDQVQAEHGGRQTARSPKMLGKAWLLKAVGGRVVKRPGIYGGHFRYLKGGGITYSQEQPDGHNRKASRRTDKTARMIPLIRDAHLCFHKHVFEATDIRREEQIRINELPTRAAKKEAREKMAARAKAARAKLPPKPKGYKAQCQCVWKDANGKPIPKTHVAPGATTPTLTRLEHFKPNPGGLIEKPEHEPHPIYGAWMAADEKAATQFGSYNSLGKLSERRTVAAEKKAKVTKFERQRRFMARGNQSPQVKLLEAIQTQMQAPINEEGESYEREVAAYTYLLYVTGFRNGHEKKKKKQMRTGIGASQLKLKHMKVDKRRKMLIFDFDGKGDKPYRKEVQDPDLYAWLAPRKEGGGWDPDLDYGSNPNDDLFAVKAKDAVKFLKQSTGMPDIIAHDLRTHRATATAIAAMAHVPKPKSTAEFKSAQKQVATIAAEEINDTVNVALEKYVDFALWDQWDPKHTFRNEIAADLLAKQKKRAGKAARRTA